jgi:hypothetical protein
MQNVEENIQNEIDELFIEQKTRMNVMNNMYNMCNSKFKITSEDAYNTIMTDNKNTITASRKGFVYEVVSLWLFVTKCFDRLNYKSIVIGDINKPESLTDLKDIKSLLSVSLEQGNDISDMTFKEETGRIICVSIKNYSKKISKKGTDINEIDSTLLKKKYENYAVSLITRKKEDIRKSKKQDVHQAVFVKMVEDGLLFDEEDVKKAFSVFMDRFKNMNMLFKDFIEYINSEFLNSSRKQLVKKLNQQMALKKFENSYKNNKQKLFRFCVAHKMRSGKCITMLLICKYLMEEVKGVSKILLMTSVPSTINDFVKDLNVYIDFKDIIYKTQGDFDKLDQNFKGIMFCSTQYLKTEDKPGKKKELLKSLSFDVMFIDECHLGSSTIKTKKDILDIDIVDKNIVDKNVEDLSKSVKVNIFASGTADKTIKYYGIKTSNISLWEREDESCMKKIMSSETTSSDKDYIFDFMCNRHGEEFIQCYNDITLNKDYSNCPTQVLMKHSIPDNLVEDIKKYNAMHSANVGYSSSSLFALLKKKKNVPEKDKNGNIIKTTDGNDLYDYEYTEEFEICKTSDGKDILKWFLEDLISNDPNQNTVMKQIEKTQTERGSRKSSKENPLLFIMYLPTHTRNNKISVLQPALIKFLNENNLWKDYNIEYSNSLDNSNGYSETYNEYIIEIMNRTKNAENKKKGCILLLGDKGTTGVTYDDCDVTISLDEGHNLSNQQQRWARALTPATGKTVGINVDMNIQRTYSYINDIIQKHRKVTKTTMSNAEILKFLYENNIFLFDPHRLNYGKVKTMEILSYYDKECEKMIEQIDDTYILENIECEIDYLENIKELNNLNTNLNKNKKVGSELEGAQKDCPKGDKTKTEIDIPLCKENGQKENTEKLKDNVEKINNTKKLAVILFPCMAVLSKILKIYIPKEILVSEKSSMFIQNFLSDKQISLKNISYSHIVEVMNKVIDENEVIINNIIEIYRTAPSNKFRELIAKHFIPSIEDKKDRAEIPTPVNLVDEMLDKMPEEFWKSPKKVLEPCCGKGNFVLGDFEKFNKGLQDMYPDKIVRCRVIMTECIYYADLTYLNVFITTEIMKCHIQNYCDLDELDYSFNFSVGNTLELNTKDKWGVEEFDAIIGNPPYDDKDATGDNKLYLDFIKYSINKLKEDMYLLFIVPINIKNYITNQDKNRSYIDNFMQLKYISFNTANKYFPKVGSYFCYFLMNKTIVKSCEVEVSYMRNQIVEYSKIHINEKDNLPLCVSNLDIELINKVSNLISNKWDNFDIKKAVYLKKKDYTHQRIRKSHIDKGEVKEIEDSEYKYKIIDKVTKKNPFPGICYYYNKTMVDYGKPKIVLCSGGYLMPSYDENGSYNLSDNMLYLLVNNKNEYNGMNILVNSGIVNYLNKISMTDGLHGRDTVIKSLKSIDLTKINNENDVYKLYNISCDEIELIKKTI